MCGPRNNIECAFFPAPGIKVIFVTAATDMLFVRECFVVSVNRSYLNQRAFVTVDLLSLVKFLDGVVTYLSLRLVEQF